MELPRPEPTTPALLALGPLDRTFIDLRRLCRDAGITLDRADSEARALEVFFQRGGHDAILCTGALRDDQVADRVLDTLRGIDDGLVLWKLDEFVASLSPNGSDRTGATASRQFKQRW
ncbi:MAG: hypothetical protein H6832_16955 [Planctomycetes bacterium]|nr:hypothetical protein [Planctomycetota bacterium]MCB9890685.1 hypothetical protein [Planctomycetota bacterium]MCB9920092.1 hypothetical protein [Planctomycetota bacterium]